VEELVTSREKAVDALRQELAMVTTKYFVFVNVLGLPFGLLV